MAQATTIRSRTRRTPRPRSSADEWKRPYSREHAAFPAAVAARAQVLAAGRPHRQRLRRPQPRLRVSADGSVRVMDIVGLVAVLGTFSIGPVIVWLRGKHRTTRSGSSSRSASSQAAPARSRNCSRARTSCCASASRTWSRSCAASTTSSTRRSRAWSTTSSARSPECRQRRPPQHPPPRVARPRHR